MKKRLTLEVLALATALISARQSTLAEETSSTIIALDIDADGAVSLAEAKKAAATLFDRIESYSQGTISELENDGRVSVKDFQAADPDSDGTLTKYEFLSAVETLFKEADANKDGAIDSTELGTKQGNALQRATR